MKIFKLKNEGFTLIELLVVVAIIGILSSIVLVSLNSAKAKANATKVVADLNQMMKGIEVAKTDGCDTADVVIEGSPMTLCGVSYLALVPLPPTGYAYEASLDGTTYTDLVSTGAGLSIDPSSTYFIKATGFSGADEFICTDGSCSCSTADQCKQ